jgi:hypothetical protein
VRIWEISVKRDDLGMENQPVGCWLVQFPKKLSLPSTFLLDLAGIA